MKRWIPLLSVAAIFSIAAFGCGTTSSDSGTVSDDSAPTSDVTLVSYDDQKLCGSCGHAFAKDSEHQCDSEHAACEKCSLHAGSELCCKLGEDSAGKTFCGSCGQVAGTEVCCLESAEVCESCNLHKGSPLCCKLVATAVMVDDSQAEPGQEPAAEPSQEPSAESGQEPHNYQQSRPL